MNKKIEEFKRTSDSQPLAEIIDRLFKVYNLEGKMKEMDVINAWPELMGIAVARRTKNIYIKGNTLHLEMDSSVMREELYNGKQIILERINQHAGKELITDIWFS
ncbi:MAG: DUF721 domain-containing protein [Flavobacteriia bacterium]|jgi:hypothetical protein|nr:DUF721 domain-containing protein [Flavobacteriia bacterium]NBV67899.1 DUF721 domain-containing protein [Flavobacteriia bacterium]